MESCRELLSRITLLSAAVAAVSCAVEPGPRRRDFRRRRHLPLSDLRQMGRGLQGQDRHQHELPVDRLGRRHQADRGQDRRFRRLRHAAEARGSGQGRPAAIPDGDGRRRAGGQSAGHQAGPAEARRQDRSPASISARSPNGTTRRSPRSIPASSCPTRRSRRCTAPTARAPTSSSPTTCRASSPDFKAKVGENTSVELPGGLGGKGNEGVAALTGRTDGAIGYVEYAYALQNKMTYAQAEEP